MSLCERPLGGGNWTVGLSPEALSMHCAPWNTLLLHVISLCFETPEMSNRSRHKGTLKSTKVGFVTLILW